MEWNGLVVRPAIWNATWASVKTRPGRNFLMPVRRARAGAQSSRSEGAKFWPVHHEYCAERFAVCGALLIQAKSAICNWR